MSNFFRPLIALVAIVILSTAACAETDPLPSWNDGATKL